jgi:uncharacterized membrane protein (UPF0127 family)
MSKRMILFALLFLVAFGLIGWGIYILSSRHPEDYTEATVTIHPTSTTSEIATSTAVAPKTASSLALKGHIFYIDLADTMAKRSQGLSGRTSLRDDQGMFFIFPYYSKQSFWMHGMNFPIDIVWIAGDEIVDITRNAPAPLEGESDMELTLYSPSAPVNRVLEINAGLSDKYGFKIGDKITLKLAGG